MFYSIFSADLVIGLCKNKVFSTPFCPFQFLALILQGQEKGQKISGDVKGNVKGNVKIKRWWRTRRWVKNKMVENKMVENKWERLKTEWVKDGGE